MMDMSECIVGSRWIWRIGILERERGSAGSVQGIETSCPKLAIVIVAPFHFRRDFFALADVWLSQRAHYFIFEARVTCDV